MYKVFFRIQSRHWWFIVKKDLVLDMIRRFARTNTRPQILDIGCGSGLMLGALSEIGPTSGLDYSDDAIRFCKEIFSGVVKKGSLPDEVPFENGSFDLITALDVIEHIDRDVDSLKAINELLTPCGKAIITVPAYMFLWTNFDELNEHKRRYTLGELEEKLSRAGFSIETITYFNTLLFPVIYIVRTINRILHRSGASDVEMPSRIINSILRAIFGFERTLLKYVRLPFGVSILAIVSKGKG